MHVRMSFRNTMTLAGASERLERDARSDLPNRANESRWGAECWCCAYDDGGSKEGS
jgi:hypothetical protein